jgi:predicted NUDIX family NTP pyrophosphohydrolase
MKQSAGILLFREKPTLQFFLVHMGGPFWKNKEKGAWTIPKGEVEVGEDFLDSALREFYEETGFELKGSPAQKLKPIKQKSGKIVHAWAYEGDANSDRIRSNTFTIEWPPGSGKMQDFPEIDRAAWKTAAEARELLISGQYSFIEQVVQRVTDTD